MKRNLGYAAYDGQKVVIRTRFDISGDEFAKRERCVWPPQTVDQVSQRSGLARPTPPTPTPPPVIEAPPTPSSATPTEQPEQESQDITTIFDQLREEQERRHDANRSRRRRRRDS